MSYVIADPEMMTSAATDLAGIGSALSEAHTAAAAPTVGLVPAAADEVSVGIAHLFSQHAQDYQGLAGRAAASQEQFVQNLKASAVSYTGIEDAIVSLLQGLDTGVHSTLGAIEGQVVNFITGSNSWINLIPGPLQFVVGIPLLGLVLIAIPFAVVSAIIQAAIRVITG